MDHIRDFAEARTYASFTLKAFNNKAQGKGFERSENHVALGDHPCVSSAENIGHHLNAAMPRPKLASPRCGLGGTAVNRQSSSRPPFRSSQTQGGAFATASLGWPRTLLFNAFSVWNVANVLSLIHLSVSATPCEIILSAPMIPLCKYIHTAAGIADLSGIFSPPR